MYSSFSHTSGYSFRRSIATVMTVFYLVIVFGPLTPLPTPSSATDGAVVRECSGDCTICGCSPESRASNTCCCSRKVQQQAHLHADDVEDGADCCNTEAAEKKTVIACGCPCGSGKQTALSAAGTFEVLPYHFTERFSTPHGTTTFGTPTLRLTSRISEPPDPPPKLV